MGARDLIGSQDGAQLSLAFGPGPVLIGSRAHYSPPGVRNYQRSIDPHPTDPSGRHIERRHLVGRHPGRYVILVGRAQTNRSDWFSGCGQRPPPRWNEIDSRFFVVVVVCFVAFVGGPSLVTNVYTQNVSHSKVYEHLDARFWCISPRQAIYVKS